MLSMESAGDHLMAFVDCVAEPSETLAPWTGSSYNLIVT